MLLLLALGAACSAYGLARALANRIALRPVLGPVLWIVVPGLSVSLALGLAALWLELRSVRRGEPRASPLAPLRMLFVVLVAAWALFLALVQPFQRLWFDLALGCAAGAFAGLVALERPLERLSSRLRRFGDLSTFSLCASAVLIELCLRGVAAQVPSPLLARVGDAPRQLLERFRCRPGEVRFGFPCNRNGHYDTEFYRRREGERLVASIGDSFNLGAVPHGWHFTTVCERNLGCPVYNLGVAGIGPPEYLRLLVDEAMPLDPGLVVIDVFVGNDLTFPEVEKGLPDAALRSWLERDRVLLWVVPQRLARIAEERRRQGDRWRPIASVQGERERATADSQASLESAFPWLTDPSLEAGTMSEPAYLRLETRRALENCSVDPVSFSGFCGAMLAMKRAAASTPLCVMLIPDEFQVEDDVWGAVRAGAGAELERDRPQRLVAGWLDRNGIPCLDLLPAMRAVPPMTDGKRHLYHLRDTHFNARGNRVAGEELARFARAHMR